MELEETYCTVCNSKDSNFFVTGQDFEYETSQNDFFFVRCNKCGHIYMNPRPKISESHLIYPGDYYARQVNKGFASYLLDHIKQMILMRRVRKLIDGIEEQGTVLEIGCGDGANLLAIRTCRPDLNLIGIDLHFSEIHKRRLQEAGVELIENVFEKVETEIHADLVIMNQLIEHLWDTSEGLIKVKKMLKPQGKISISTPNIDGYDRRWFKGLWGGFHVPRHLNLFNEKTISLLLFQFDLVVTDRVNLFAPLIWVTSVHNYLKSKNLSIHRMFTYYNLPALAVFCLLDLAMLSIQKKTSNMQIIAVKREASIPFQMA